jgi:glycosyltransferase involved in cell wall biosynthesis
MRVAVDGYNMAMVHGTGVATYGVALAQTLQGMGTEVEGVFGLDVGRRPDTRELLFFDSLGDGHRATDSEIQRSIARQMLLGLTSAHLMDVPLTDQIEKRAFSTRLPTFSRLLSWPFLFEVAEIRFKYFRSVLTVTMKNPPDIMHWTYPIPIRMRGSKNIYTIHDLVPLRLPYATLDDKRYYYRLVRWCVEQGDHICTVSESSRDDILGRFPVSPEKVTNTYQTSPVPDDVAASSQAENALIVQHMFGLAERDYLLFFGAIDPKKNLHRIVDAYLTANPGCALVVVTARDWGMDKAGRRKDAATPRDPLQFLKRPGILHLDYLPRSILFRLIRAARAVMFPSLFEGFGLPALEAIQLGTPVIASNLSSLPEVVGDAGLLVDPYDIRDIASAINVITKDQDCYARLCAAGAKQTNKFSEANYRARLSAMYAATMAGTRATN